MRTIVTFPTTSSGPISEYNGVLHCKGSDFEEFPDKVLESPSPLSEPFFKRRMKLLSRPDDFMLYGKLGIYFLSTSHLLYPKMEFGWRLNRVRPHFYMISDNPNVDLGTVDCSLRTGRIALKDDYHQKRMHMLAYTPMEYNYFATLAKTFIIPARQKQFIYGNNFNKAAVRWIAIAMNTNPAITGSFTNYPFGYQQLDLRLIRTLRGSQPIIDFVAPDKCRL